MALTQNDLVILSQPGVLQPIIPTGVVITDGASPVISWDGQPSVTYSALAAPAGVFRTAPVTQPDLTTWQSQRVAPDPNIPNPIPNPSGRMVGTVVKVLLVGDPPTVLFLVVRTDDGMYYLTPAANMRILPLA